MTRVLLYELNEVPWTLIDYYVANRPRSSLARLLRGSATATTVCRDTADLQPWRTWPSFHKSMYTDEHCSMDLGQDPKTIHGENMWDVADSAGRSVGLFGPLQTWPAREFQSGGFYVPDTFAKTPDTVPGALTRFQRFNLAMTAENSFSSDAPISARDMVGVGLDLATRGLTVRSARTLVRHLVSEVQDNRYKAARPMMQVVPSFDLYWRLHQKASPDLSIFFTNHVAGMMHRYWGDAMPGYSESYKADTVYSTFVMSAMDLFDQHVARILSYVSEHPDTIVVVASSMGQGPIEYKHLDATYVVDDALRLSQRLDLPTPKVGLAMYPRTSLDFVNHEDAAAAAMSIGRIRTGTTPLFTQVRVEGTTVSFEVDFHRGQSGASLPRQAVIDPRDTRGRGELLVDISEIGVEIKPRIGGGNTAYHIPEGVFMVSGSPIAPSDKRAEVDVLDAAPYILGLLGCAPGEGMRGSRNAMEDALEVAHS